MLRMTSEREITADKAASTISGWTSQIEGLYQQAISPYPGEISDQIECPEKFHPNKKVITNDSLHITAIENLHLSDRLAPGACGEESASYKSIVAMFYCAEQKKLFKLEFIFQKGDYPENKEVLLSSLSCN